MAITSFVGSGYVGNFYSLSDLNAKYPANLYAGRVADITTGTTSARYYSDGNSWGVYAGAAIASLVSGAGINSTFPLRKLSAALARTRNGGGNTKVLLIGDSTGAGSGATGASGYQPGGRLKNIGVRLSEYLNRSILTNAHAAFGNNNATSSTATFAAWDPRFAFSGSDWSFGSYGEGTIGGLSYRTSVNGATLTFTPSATGGASASIDTFVVWYVRASASIGTPSGSFSWKVDGGSATVVNTAIGGAEGLASVTIPAGSIAGHTLTLTNTSGTDIWIAGIEAYDSTKPQVQIINAGWNMAKAAEFVFEAYPWSSLNAIATLAPHLSVIQLQINDASNATPISTYRAQLIKLIDKCLLSGDVILRSGYPSLVTFNANTGLADQQRYRDEIRRIAAEKGIIFDDVFGRLESYETQKAIDPSMYTDSLHPNGPVYARAANELANLIALY